MNKVAKIGDNNPPDPIDEALAPYGDFIAEAETWLDGAVVENEGQMKAVDDLTKNIKAALKTVTEAEKSAAAPHYDAWKNEKARWKPTLDDLTRIRDGLVEAVSAFKAKLAAEKKAAERAAWEAADKARREAEAKAAAAEQLRRCQRPAGWGRLPHPPASPSRRPAAQQQGRGGLDDAIANHPERHEGADFRESPPEHPAQKDRQGDHEPDVARAEEKKTRGTEYVDLAAL